MSDKFGWEKAARKDAGRRARHSGEYYQCKQKKIRPQRPAKQQASQPTFRMPFGKYKGTPLASVPHDYLIWLLLNVEKIDGRLRGAIDLALSGSGPSRRSRRGKGKAAARRTERHRFDSVERTGSGYVPQQSDECPF